MNLEADLRVVTFDYPLGQLDGGEPKQLMGDLIWSKQEDFLSPI